MMRSLARVRCRVTVDPTSEQKSALTSRAYIYNPVGNRLSRVDSVEGTTTYTYDANDRLLNETIGGVTTIYGYDNNGNTISKTTGSEATQHTWNDENRLVEVQTPTGDLATSWGYCLRTWVNFSSHRG